jgi:hypothetical protein
MQLDSFMILKSHQSYYVKYAEECSELAKNQEEILKSQDDAITGFLLQIEELNKMDQLQEAQLQKNIDYITKLEKKSKGAKIRNRILLIGSGVIITSLTTALIIKSL